MGDLDLAECAMDKKIKKQLENLGIVPFSNGLQLPRSNLIDSI